MELLAKPSSRQLAILRVALHVASLLPLARLLFLGLTGGLGDEPVRAVLWETGDWSLYMLCLTLAVTPLRRVTGWNWLAAFRRLPGMYAFAYGALHFATYLWLRRSGELLALLARILTQMPLLTGFISLLIMLALAATSFQAAMRWLGGMRWQWLHRLTYISAVLAVVHYWLEVARYGSNRPLWFGAIVATLLLFRLAWWFRSQKKLAAAQK
ncbi:MAG: sulfoxide reductase heme-binding subunit YedZ [Burkholderiaceae bacterium]|nr:sulfoxide reductase heme-binding subunit YedZ [Burkholderiaceae bacterium]